MKRCAYCNTTILFGGVKDNDLRYCNSTCYNNAAAMAVARSIPQDIVRKHVDEVHAGLCPECHGRGPIDVHTSYFVWSLLVLTSWSSKPKICCRSCGLKSQITSALGSLLVGWWGFPWGLILTPIQITRNIVAICRPPDGLRPSEHLHKLISINLAGSYLAQQSSRTGQAISR